MFQIVSEGVVKCWDGNSSMFIKN